MTTRSITLLAAGAAAAIVFGGTNIAFGGTNVVNASSAAASIPLCQASQLAPRYERFEGTAGTFYDYWQLIDVGGTCHTQGWVGGLNFGPDGRPLPTTLHRTGGPSHPIVLAHGQHVSWSFGYTDPGVINCKPENAVSMILTPPDNFSPVLARRGEPACNGDVKYETPLVLGG